MKLLRARGKGRPAPPDVAPSAAKRWARVLHHGLTWTSICAGSVAGLAALADGTRLILAAAPARFVLAGAASAAGLAVLLGLVVGPTLAFLDWLSTRIAARGWQGKLLAPLVVLAFAGCAGWVVTNVRHRQDPGMRMALIGISAAMVTVCLLSARPSAHRMLRLLALGIALGTFVIDASLPRWYYRELHDLLAMITVAGLLGILVPGRWRRGVGWWATRLGGSVLVALVVLLSVDRLAPGWRAPAHEHGLYGDALARMARGLVDFDRDGFSPVAWGGDCDDLSASRHPLALDGPGLGDRNCNGVDPPRHPTEGDRGLAPAAGDANAPTGGLDLVLLVTVDALRADSFRPDLMPATWAAGAAGVVFERLYACSTRTAVTLPLLQRSHRGGEPLGVRLASQGITTTAIVADQALEGTEAIAATFAHLRRPARGRWRASETTAQALRAIDEAGVGRHYLWVHYYDAHTPYPAVAASPIPTPAGLDPSYAHYATGVAAVDAGIGQLLAGLAHRDRRVRTLIMVTGDHGEAFGEHRMLFHAASAFEPLVRVPGLLLAPGLSPGRYPHLGSHTDIFPTILGAFGLARPDDEVLGRSWLRLRAAPAAPLHDFVVIRSAQAASGGDVMSPLLALVDPRYKLTKSIEDGLTSLYDVVANPAENVDLWPVHPNVAVRLERQLERYRDVIGYPADEELADLKTFGARLLGPNGELY